MVIQQLDERSYFLLYFIRFQLFVYSIFFCVNNPVLYAKLTAVYMQLMHFMQCIHLFYYKQFIFKLLLITYNLQLQTFFRCIYNI